MAAGRLRPPPLPEARICLWEDLTFSGMGVIEQAGSLEELRLALGQLLCEVGDPKDPRVTAHLDLYAYSLQFARDNRFNREQASAFLSIVRRLHAAATGTPLGNMDECFRYFNELVLCHAVRRPPFSIDLFNAEQVKLITDYVVNTYFRHFKLYKYVFTPQIRTDLSLTYVGMPETPPGSAAEEEERETEEEVPAQEELPQAPAPPGSELRQYIADRVAEQVSELREAVEGQLRVSEQKLSARLSALERPGAPRGGPKHAGGGK